MANNIKDWIESSGDLAGLANELAQFMKNEKLNTNLGHYPIQAADLSDESLFGEISKVIDLDDDEALSYINGILGRTDDDLDWNKSVKELIKTFKTKIANNTTGTIPIHGTNIAFSILNHVLKANAGWSFKQNPWVQPNINIDNQTYAAVRDGDEIEEVLNSQKNMQFTHTQTDGTDDVDNQVTKYIRLLMPKYTRRVEVEDLNRNFWVIGQVLTAISAYLFDEDSPLKLMLKQILNEIVQLWENLIYIWAAINQGGSTFVEDVHCMVVYVPNDRFNHEFKFDGYDMDEHGHPNSLTDCKILVEYLKDQYRNQNLCIVPVVRKGNYFKNYYDKEIYYGILYYNAITSEWKLIPFETTITLENSITVEIEDTDILYYFKEQSTNYRCIYNKTLSPADDSYIRAIRSKVRFDSSISPADFNEDNDCIDKVHIMVQDAGKALTGYTSDWVEFNNTTGTRPALTSGTAMVDKNSSNRGLYLCELTTKMGTPTGGEVVYNGSANLLKIGNFVPWLSKSSGNISQIAHTENSDKMDVLGVGLMTDDTPALTQTINGYSIYIKGNNSSPLSAAYNYYLVSNPPTISFYYNELAGNANMYNDFKRLMFGSTTIKMPFDSDYNNVLNYGAESGITYADLGIQGKNNIIAAFQYLYGNGYSAQLSNDNAYVFGIDYGASPWAGGINPSAYNKPAVLNKIGYSGSESTYNSRLYWADDFITHLYRVITGSNNLAQIDTSDTSCQIKVNGQLIAYIDKIVPFNFINSVSGLKAPGAMTQFFKNAGTEQNPKYWRTIEIKYPKTITDKLQVVIKLTDVNDNNTVALSYLCEENQYSGRMQIVADNNYTYGYEWNGTSRETTPVYMNDMPGLVDGQITNQSSPIWKSN